MPVASIRLVAVLGLGRRDEIKHELKRLHSVPLLAGIQSHLSSHWLQERKTDTVSFPFDIVSLP